MSVYYRQGRLIVGLRRPSNMWFNPTSAYSSTHGTATIYQRWLKCLFIIGAAYEIGR